MLFGVLEAFGGKALLKLVAVDVEVEANLVERVELLVAQQEIDGRHKHRSVVKWQMIHTVVFSRKNSLFLDG